jgi:hypothetical protein
MLTVLIKMGWYNESNLHVITGYQEKIVLFRLHYVFIKRTAITLSPIKNIKSCIMHVYFMIRSAVYVHI